MDVAMPSRGSARAPDEVLSQLADVCTERGLGGLSNDLAGLRAWIADDLATVERELRALDRRDTPVHSSASHLLALEGKRLRPMCVLLAARAGAANARHVRELAVAVELVHNATLLHDDVVDLGDMRRGTATARVIYGNAASVFGGDWLLVEALQRIQRTGHIELLERAIAVLKSMIQAEALQLAQRGTLDTTVDDYMRVIDGKTASLFAWALRAGATAAGLSEPPCAALETYGRHLGVAFQIVDDVLDFDGEPEVVGKSLLTDLREGKCTFPLLLAFDRADGFRDEVRAALAKSAVGVDSVFAFRVHDVLRETRAIDDAMARAKEAVMQAVDGLAGAPGGRAKDALCAIAAVVVERRK